VKKLASFITGGWFFWLTLMIPPVLVAVTPLSWLVWLSNNILIRAAFWSAVIFIVYYTSLAPWWRNPVGRMLISLDFAVVAVLFGPILRLDFGVTIPPWLLTRCSAGGLALVPLTIISRTILLGRVHRWLPRQPWKHEPSAASGIPAEKVPFSSLDEEDMPS